MVLKLRLTIGFSLILVATADHASVLLSNSVSVPVSTSYNAADSFASPSSSFPSSASLAYSSTDQSGSYAVKEESQPVASTYSISSTDTKTTKTETAPSVSGTPFSGNLYYYYPVAAYPIADPISNKDSASSYGNTYVQNEDSNLSPLIYLLVPLVILIVAIPFLALLGVNVTGSRQFLSGRSKDLDEKFGSFSDLQREIDVLLEKYVNALESYQCKDRIVCELGVRAQGLSGKEMFFSIVGWLAPKHSILGDGRLDLLRDAATKDFTMESCQQAYECHPPAIVQEGFTKETIMSHLAPSNSS